MKRYVYILSMLVIPFLSGTSQVPQGFRYQAVVRDGSGAVLNSQTVGIRISIHSGDPAGSIVYQEVHSTVTSSEGLINLNIGRGTAQTGTFETIDWSAGNLFLEVEADISGGTNYTSMGTSELLSVPYALFAASGTGFRNMGTWQAGIFKPGDYVSSRSSLDAGVNSIWFLKNALEYSSSLSPYLDQLHWTELAPPSLNNNPNGWTVVDAGLTTNLKVGIGNTNPNNALTVQGDVSIPADTALFEVKDQQGNTVFAVYQDGAVLYINESAKGGRGGFAVGGRRPVKGGIITDILRITPDSVRIYINDSTLSKGGRGGFAVGGRTPAKGLGSTDYFSVSAQQSLDTVNGSPRILWYPRKEAFLAGNVLIQAPDSVGRNSFSTGYQSKAVGSYSQALGYKAISRGNYSSAFGYMSVANKDNSFAFGQNALALNQESYAFGRGAKATGFRSFSFGSAGVDYNGSATGVTSAIGDYSFAIGQGSVSLGNGAVTLGLSDSANGSYSIAMGIGSSARNYGSLALGYVAKATNDYATAIGNTAVSSGYSSTAIGFSTLANGDYAVALGYSTQALANYSTALGYGNAASGWYSMATGNGTHATGGGSFTMGGNTTASGFYSLAAGGGTTASGAESFAMGSITTASGSLSTALGFYSKAKSYASLVIGQFNDTTSSSSTSWTASDPVFVIGNGSADWSRSNALTILKSGQIGLQSVIQPTYALELPNSATVGVGSARAYAWTTYSDQRLKDHLAKLNYGIADVMKLEPRQYMHHATTDQTKWSGDKGIHTIGLVAQEVYRVIPEAVEVPKEGSGELWGINYDKLVPVLIQAIQDQQRTIEKLEKQAAHMGELEQEIAELKKQMPR